MGNRQSRMLLLCCLRECWSARGYGGYVVEVVMVQVPLSWLHPTSEHPAQGTPVGADEYEGEDGVECRVEH